MKRRVVITGLGTLNPLAHNAIETWEMAARGQSGIGAITLFDPTDYKTKIAGEVKGFNPEELLGRKEARRMDRMIQLAMAAANQAIGDARLEIHDGNAHRIGAVMGSGIGGLGTAEQAAELLAQKGPSRISPFFIPMMLADSAPGMISITHGLKGPNMSIATACASSNNAMGESAKMIQRGDADVMITGGAEAGVLRLCIAGFNAMGALSTRNDEPHLASRPFDKNRDGFVASEGATVLIFEERDHALARGAHIYAEFLGYGTSADAYHICAPPEDAAGAVAAMKLALADAGLHPEGIDYINAHGTSTPLNDRSETVAIKKVFGEHAYHIPISSTKSVHGHLLGATSALEALIAVQALHHQFVPPTMNYETADPDCDLDYVPNVGRAATLRTVMSNGFGFGGHNAVVILGAAVS